MNRPPMPVRFQTATPCVLVGRAPLSRLAHFRWLMAEEGRRVDLGRMCLDRRYALALLADAHASASDPLRELAVQLFADYEPVPVGGLQLQ